MNGCLQPVVGLYGRGMPRPEAEVTLSREDYAVTQWVAASRDRTAPSYV